MSEIVLILFFSLVGLITGFFDSLVGAGGLFSIPSLVFLGLPPQTAIATDRFGVIGQAIVAVIKFWKAKKIVWKFVPFLVVLALIGSYIGANFLLNTDPKNLSKIIAIIIFVLLPLVFLKNDFGIKHFVINKKKAVVGLLSYFVIMVFAGFSGQGTGPMVFYTLTFFFGLTMIESLGTGLVPWLVLSVSSTIIFGLNGIIDYKVGAVLFVTMSIGSYAGAHIAIKKGDIWIKRLFVVLVVVMGLKLLIFH
ncbi:MAG: sulfite exporter TauE/SafE family protein [Nanoarchaeota archaeon]